jgi:hypothetical protein
LDLEGFLASKFFVSDILQDYLPTVGAQVTGYLRANVTGSTGHDSGSGPRSLVGHAFSSQSILM